MIDKHMLGIAIKNARCESRMLSTRLADKIGVSNSHMSHMENGKCDITVDKLNLISEVLSIPVEVLILQATSPKKSRHMQALLILDIETSSLALG